MNVQKPILTEKQAEALELQREGLAYWEIAAELGISEAAVNVRLRRARRNLKRAQGLDAASIDKRPEADLSPRETEVLNLKKQGLTLRQIADEMGIAFRTVKNYINIIRKKGVHVERRYSQC